MQDKELDQYSAYFDDLWVYRRGGEKQECCIWAVDTRENRHTPLKEGFTVSTSLSSSSELRLINANQCAWVFRKEMNESECDRYSKLIMDFQTACENANWQRGPMYTEESPLKLSELGCIAYNKAIKENYA